MTARIVLAAIGVVAFVGSGHPSAAPNGDDGPRQTQTPARDNAAVTAPIGTATLSGVVMTDEANSHPLRRTVVTLNASDIHVGRTTVTDDAGRFTFASLPAGRFSLVATKAGYLTTYYRSKRPGRAPAVPIPLAESQQLAGVTMKMIRGGVITGHVLDQSGKPVLVSIRASLVQTIDGERTLNQQFGGNSFADDRGIYRIFGLVPGDYVVSASVPRFGAVAGDVRVMTAADLQRAEIAIREAHANTAPGSTPAAPPPPAADVQMMGYATVYYPGATEFANAAAISVGPSEERTDVDFPLAMIPMARIEGVAMFPDGQPVANGMVTLVSTGPLGGSSSGFQTSKTGAFAFPSLSPGPYTLMARASPPATDANGAPVPTTPAVPTTPPMWALMDFTSDGRNVHDMVLTLQPGLTFTGRVVFDATTGPPSALTNVRVSLDSAQTSGAVFGVAPVQADASGAFTFTGITPGKYRLSATIAATTKATWTMKSAVIDGRETSDLPADIRESVTNAVVTLGDRHTELSGMLQDATGAPSPEYSLVVFSVDKRYWTRNSRRMRGPVRPGADGHFIVSDLPPGEYFLAAITDADQSELNDASLLNQLAAAAVRVTLVEGEKKVQDIKIAGGTGL
jgi:hypothetical protein